MTRKCKHQWETTFTNLSCSTQRPIASGRKCLLCNRREYLQWIYDATTGRYKTQWKNSFPTVRATKEAT